MSQLFPPGPPAQFGHPGPAALQGPPPQGGGERAPIQILKQMIQLAQMYQQVEPDAADKATMAKVLATLHQYLAKDQQDMTTVGSPSIGRVLRKAFP